MFAARHCWRAIASLVAQLVLTSAARGSDSGRAVLVSSSTSDARLTRALVLIRGELSALGLEVRVTGMEATDVASPTAETRSDRLSLDIKDGLLTVRVFTPEATAPLVESIDFDGPDVTAEVMAVRAVEALRAARLLPTEDRGTLPQVQPGEAQSAKAQSAKAQSAKAQSAEPALDEPASDEHAEKTPDARTAPIVRLSLGPTFIQNPQGLPQLNARAAVLVGPRWGFLSLGAEGSLSDLRFERAVGSAQVSRRSMFLQLGARIRLQGAWEVSGRAGISYLHYAANGVAEAGYLARDLKHDTGGVSLSLSGAYYFVRAFAVYLDVAGLMAFDAARVRLADESVVTLDRPSFALGGGVILGIF